MPSTASSLSGPRLSVSPSRINQDTYTSPSGSAKPLPTPGRRKRSSSPDEDHLERGTKRHCSPSNQVSHARSCSPSPSSKSQRLRRPSPSSRSPRRTKSSHEHLPEFIEGSSRDTRERSRGGSRTPPRVAREPPSTSEFEDDERESAELKRAAGKLWELFWNIQEGAKLRGHNTPLLGPELDRMLHCSRRELGLVAAPRTLPDPNRWHCQAPAPAAQITLPPLRSVINYDNPCIPPQTLPPLHSNAIIDYSNPSSPLHLAGFDLSENSGSDSDSKQPVGRTNREEEEIQGTLLSRPLDCLPRHQQWSWPSESPYPSRTWRLRPEEDTLYGYEDQRSLHSTSQRTARTPRQVPLPVSGVGSQTSYHPLEGARPPVPHADAESSPSPPIASDGNPEIFIKNEPITPVLTW